MRRRLLAGFLFWGSLASFLSATPSPSLNAQDHLIETGMTAMYNLDYTGARAAFQEMTTVNPNHPFGRYGLAMTLWWELTNEYDEENDALEKEFQAAADETIKMSRALVKQGDPLGEARLCWGGALGLQARWDAIQGHWLASYRKGKQAFGLQSEVMREHPQLYDAYLGPGIFHYYVATLSGGAKVIGHMIFGGSKEQGLKEIRLAMTKGRFSKTAARLFLINIFVNTEKDPRQALVLLEEGRKEYPDSPFFHFVELLVLEEAGEWEALQRGAELYLKKTEEGAPFYSPQRLHMGLFALANSRLGKKDYSGALTLYNRVLAERTRDDRWVSLTYLNRAKTYDLLGRLDEAAADYRTVMKRRDVWDLHEKAQKLLRRPYGQDGAQKVKR